MSTSYQAGDIEVLEGLDPVRRRPGMYTDTSSPEHLAWEVIDNSVDEALAGHARRIEVVLHADGSLSVRDDGRGMPVDLHPTLKRPGVEVILTTLHAGSKFSDRVYRYAGGLHGVGVSVVNALSRRLEVSVWRDGGEYRMAFAQGEPVEPLRRTPAPRGTSPGTLVRFWPEPRYFATVSFSYERLARLLRAKAVLLSGLEVRIASEDPPRSDRWRYEDGLGPYLAEALGEAVSRPAPPLVLSVPGERLSLECALAWIDPESPEAPRPTESYVNLVPTPLGGTHVSGLRTGVSDAVREFCEVRGLVPRGLKLGTEDIVGSLAYVLSLRLRDAEFAGQTKERLTARDAQGATAGALKDGLSLWLHRHPQLGEEIVAGLVRLAQARQQAASQVARKKFSAALALPGKLADCTGHDIESSELFLVEGDSAGGSARQARDRTTQAVLALRGKILNTWEARTDEILASNEVRDIAHALGVAPGQTDTRGLRYGKVCILADADSDGAHIATLLLALFLRHFRPLVAEGRVYVAQPPLYRIDVGEEVAYARDDAERDRILAELASGRKATITRFKGLGEMNPEQLRLTTMDPATRRLVRLVLPDAEEALRTEDLFQMLLARRRAGDRRLWLERRGAEARLEV
jgi:topoisomerase-4 subunit B